MKIKKYLPVCFTGRAAKDTTLSSTQPESQKQGGKRSTGMLAGLVSRSRKSSGPDIAAQQKPLAEPGSDVRAAGPRERHNPTLQQLFDAEPNHASTAGATQVPPFADERTWATASAPDIREIRPASPGSEIKLEGLVSGTPVKAAAAGGGAPLRQEPLFDLTLKKGKIRVKARHPKQDSEQARQLERLLNLRDNRATGLAWNPATGGYLIDYQKQGVRYWVGTHGKSLPAIVLPAHPAMKQGVCPPPIGLLANLSGSPDGALWREHHGQLYQWDMQQAQWKPHPLPGKGHAPITLLGRQLDGEAWARAGSLLLKLGAGGVQVREVAGLERFPVVRMDTAGRPLALDGQGQLWRPDLRKAAPRPIRLQLADGRPAFEPVQLGKPDQPVTRARARDFALAPDGRTVFVRDQQGHLYQGDLHAADTSSGALKVRRIGLPVRVPGSTEGWGVEALATSPGRSGEGAALHAVFRSSEGQRVSAAWDGEQWQPQWHVEQPLLLVSERGLQGPAMRTVCTYNDGAMLGISAAGEACQKDGAGHWRPLLQADGTPLANLQDLKLGPLGLADAKPVYALQATPDGGSRLLALEFGGNMARLPARPGVAVAAVPAQRYVSQVGVLAASSAPIRDFAVDGEGVAYHLTDDHVLVRTPPGGQPQRLPAAPPGLIQIDQIAVSSDKHQVFALARGPLGEGDAAPQLFLLRYDHASATWADCRADLSALDPETVRLGISRLGTLQLTTGPACGEGERRIHRVVPPLGAQKTYRLLATGAAEPTVSQALTGTTPKRVRIPNTGVVATLHRTAGGVTERVQSNFRTAVGHVERVLAMPKGAVNRVAEHLRGRADMAAEHHDMKTIHLELEPLLHRKDWPLPPTVAAGPAVAPAVPEAVAQACAALRGDAIDRMLGALQQIGVAAGVLGPDLTLNAEAGRRKKRRQDAVRPASKDLLPRMHNWLAEFVFRAAAQVDPSSEAAAMAPAPVFDQARVGDMRRVVELMHTLSEHGVKLPAPDLTGHRDTRDRFSILTGAIGRHLLTLERATRLVTLPQTIAVAGAGSAAEVLQRSVDADKVLRLARFGFSNWHDAEAFWEVAQTFKKEVTKPRSPFNRKFAESHAVRDAASPAEMAIKFAEAMKGLSNRSTLFGIESKGASAGVTASGTLSAKQRVGAFGFAVLGVDRTTMVGVERTADKLAEGPLVAFFVRQSNKGLTMGGGAGMDFKPLRNVLGFRLQGGAQASASLMHGKGAAMLVAPGDIDEFARRLFDPANHDPGSLLELGLNQGAIGLDMREQQLNLSANAGGPGGYAAPIPGFGPVHRHADGSTGSAFQQTGLQRGFLGANVNWGVRDFFLKLQHAWAPISGYEYQGGRGWAASAFASLVQQGGLLPHVSDAFTLVLRSLNITLLGAGVELSGVESFKRTLDWKTASRVTPQAWSQLAALAREVFPSQAIGHFDGPHLRAMIAATLEEAKSTWAARTEHERASFVDRAEQLLLQDRLAASGRAMLLPGAKIEFNIPNFRALVDTRKNSKAHRSLGPLMEASERARQAVPGLANAMRAMSELDGVNDVRLVFQMDPSYINAVNRLMLEGKLSWAEFNVMARTVPAPYRLTEICAKDSDSNRSAFTLNPLPLLAFNDSVEVSRSLFAAEVHLRYGLTGQLLGADLLPGAQRAVAGQKVLQPFVDAGAQPVPVAGGPAPVPAPDLPHLRRSQSLPSVRPAGAALKARLLENGKPLE
ncbi:AvrE-family type 3 secretion system effector [Ralstonia syzygii]|uniref:AvrE-family type 3 secretion system effector n=1 Tax=Ralstonia solanacearum species complex TaxID=3116862 RepID=UPI000E5964E0|nr:type III effector protein [Ralstonia solanacearum]AXW78376.1 type III effector protein [Ralstonia solanacearum]